MKRLSIGRALDAWIQKAEHIKTTVKIESCTCKGITLVLFKESGGDIHPDSYRLEASFLGTLKFDAMVPTIARKSIAKALLSSQSMIAAALDFMPSQTGALCNLDPSLQGLVLAASFAPRKFIPRRKKRPGLQAVRLIC
jgi:hypothetical protein